MSEARLTPRQKEQKKFAANLIRALIERHGKTFGDDWLITWEFPGYISINYLVDPEAYIAVDITSRQGFMVVDARYEDEVLSACEHRVVWSGDIDKDVEHWKNRAISAVSMIEWCGKPAKKIKAEEKELEAQLKRVLLVRAAEAIERLDDAEIDAATRTKRIIE